MPPTKIVWLATRLEDEWGLSCLMRFQQCRHYLVALEVMEDKLKQCAMSTLHEAPFNEASLRRRQRLRQEEIEARKLSAEKVKTRINEIRMKASDSPNSLANQAMLDGTIPLVPLLQQMAHMSSRSPLDVLIVLNQVVESLMKVALTLYDLQAAETIVWRYVFSQ